MIRPGIGLLSVLLGFLALPGIAMAQDTTPPAITIATPADGAEYTQGDPVIASYSCVDAESTVTECAGPVASGAVLSTAIVGDHQFTVTATDSAGNTTSLTHSYKVKPVEGDVGGGVTTPILDLSIGLPGTFSPFIPGLPVAYTTQALATVLSTAEDAFLSVWDASSVATGHLVNGPYALQNPLVVGATSNVPYATGASGPVGGAANPTTILTYNGPVTNDSVTITFTQTIAELEALRTGPYSKTLTFTLATANP
jgi:hypothetical protein